MAFKPLPKPGRVVQAGKTPKPLKRYGAGKRGDAQPTMLPDPITKENLKERTGLTDPADFGM